MKNLVKFSLLSFLLVLSSCSDDESCISFDVAGTYEGTIECSEMNSEAITFSVVAGSSDIQIIIDGVSSTIDECDIYGSTIINGTGREIDGDIVGDKISFVETTRVNGEVDIRCSWEGFKK